MLAAILESGEPSRLYTGLSLLVCVAAEGEAARGLVSFGALGPMLARDFDAPLAQLRAAADELDELELWACSAAVQATGADPATVQRELDGVMSTPRFLRETAGARLVVV